MEAYLADLPEWARGPIMAYGKQAAAALVLLLLAVALWSGYTHYTATKEAEAAYALGQVFAIEEPDKRISRLKEVINRFEGTDAADHARLMLAGQLLDDGKWDEAASAFKDAEGNLEHALADSAIMGYGYAQEETGALDSALSSYSRASDSKNGFEAVAILDKARVLLKKGAKEQALAAYDRYIDMKPQSPQLDFIRFQIQMLSAEGNGAEKTGRPQPGGDQKEGAGAG
jgi:predicted negative regulator of RcsB-dependent stress response